MAYIDLDPGQNVGLGIELLGLDPNALQAVQIEGTPVLPGIARH